MLDISKLSGNSYIPGVGETVYAIRRKKRRNSAGRWIQCPRNTDVEIVQVIVDEITFFRPIGATELAWKGAGYPHLQGQCRLYTGGSGGPAGKVQENRPVVQCGRCCRGKW